MFSYAYYLGDKALSAAFAADKPAGEARRADRDAKADAYFNEIKALYDAKDNDSTVRLTDRIVALHPKSKRAWEALVIAARAKATDIYPKCGRA